MTPHLIWAATLLVAVLAILFERRNGRLSRDSAERIRKDLFVLRTSLSGAVDDLRKELSRGDPEEQALKLKDLEDRMGRIEITMGLQH